MQSQKSKPNTKKILVLNLKALREIMNIKENFQLSYRNINFEYVVFVARLTKTGQICSFTDQTQIFTCEMRKFQQTKNLKVGSYYQCLCQLKSMNTSLQPFILNLNQVDGNYITIHMARIIKQEMQKSIIDNSNLNTSDEPQSRRIELESAMRKWIKQKEQFTLQELQQQFNASKQAELFSNVLTKLEDQGYVGNMGEGCYRCID